jgi:hypothetical protein
MPSFEVSRFKVSFAKMTAARIGRDSGFATRNESPKGALVLHAPVRELPFWEDVRKISESN